MSLSRRELIVAAAAGLGAAGCASDRMATGRASPPANRLRVAHLTDMHVTAERGGHEGFAAALRAMNRYKPDLLITGGDHVMDAFEASRAAAVEQFELYRRTLNEHTDVPTHAVIGNHDVWGWGHADRSITSDPRYGKAMALEYLRLRSPNYAFDAGRWRFIVLDSTARRGRGYVAELDEAQREWLRAELAHPPADKHLCVVSHIPVLAACVFFDGERLQRDFWHVPDSWMHREAVGLSTLFRAARVRLALSGHIHLADRVDYNDTTYLCNGAVSGNWWRGPYHETPAGFAIIDLFDDGRFHHEYVDFGWTPR
jgi:3',5'-cyclic-AMP phosphodiesterase